MNAQAPTADQLHERDAARYVQRFRAFLGQDRIDAARRAFADANIEGNPFRTLVLRHKQPWLDAFDEVQRVTLGGARRLHLGRASNGVRLAALAGRMLDRILPTLPSALQDHMRSRLLDLHGKVQPLLMEWSAAAFYLRQGFRVAWNDVNEPGPEFTCHGRGIAFEVECKHVSRRSEERLDDRQALNIGNAVLRACVNMEVCGDIVLTTPREAVPNADVIYDAVTFALRDAEDIGDLSVDIDNVGHLSGSLLAIGPDVRGATPDEIARRLAGRPHDCRGFAVGIANDDEARPYGTVLWLRGPRRTPEELVQHIASTAEAAAQQLTATLPGVVLIQVEDVTDVTLFRDRAAFRGINETIFARHEHVAAMVWRGDQVAVEGDGQVTLMHNMFVERSRLCRFEAGGIPLFDAP